MAAANPNITLQIGGMTCASCVRRVERALSRVGTQTEQLRAARRRQARKRLAALEAQAITDRAHTAAVEATVEELIYAYDQGVVTYDPSYEPQQFPPTHLAPAQIERLFRTEMGRSPARYYLEIRLDRARHLLIQSSMPVVEVAVACGFVVYSNEAKTRLLGVPAPLVAALLVAEFAGGGVCTGFGHGTPSVGPELVAPTAPSESRMRNRAPAGASATERSTAALPSIVCTTA